MNTINDKRNNVSFGLKIKTETIELLSKKAEGLLNPYTTPIVVKTNPKTKRQITVNSPMEHINALKKDIATDKFTLEIKEAQDKTYSLTYEFTNPKTSFHQDLATVQLDKFNSLLDALKSVTQESIANMRIELNKLSRKLADQKKYNNKISNFIKSEGINERFNGHADSSYAFLSGIKLPALRKLINSFPEHFKFEIVQTHTPGYKFMLKVSSTKYTSAEPILAKELNAKTRSGLSKKEITKLENEMKSIHEKLAPLHEAKQKFITIVEGEKKENLGHMGNLQQILKKTEAPGLAFSSATKEMLLNSKDITAEQMNKFTELASNPNAKGISLELYKDNFFHNYQIRLTTDVKDVFIRPIAIKSETVSKEFFAEVLESLKNIDKMAEEIKIKGEEMATFRLEQEKMITEVKKLVISKEFENKFPAPSHNVVTQGDFIKNSQGLYPPKLLKTLIEETQGLKFKIKHTGEEDFIGFYVSSEKYPKADFQKLFEYPSHGYIGITKVDCAGIIKENLTIGNIRNFEETTLKSVSEENIKIENFKKMLEE